MKEVDWSNWITDERLNSLSKSDREHYLYRQRCKGNVTKKIKHLERLKKKLELEKENYKKIKYEFDKSNEKFITIFDTLYYSVSISCNRYRYIDRTKVKQPRLSDKRKVGPDDNLTKKMYGKFKVEKENPTYSVTINLKRHYKPKNIYLGTESKIRNHLAMYYDDKVWLKKDWKVELRNRVNGRSVDDYIFKEIQKGWDKFKKKKITLDDLYQLKVSIPFMITNKMRMELTELGYSKKEISNMTPSQSWELIKKGKKK